MILKPSKILLDIIKSNIKPRPVAKPERAVMSSSGKSSLKSPTGIKPSPKLTPSNELVRSQDEAIEEKMSNHFQESGMDGAELNKETADTKATHDAAVSAGANLSGTEWWC